MTTCPTCGKTVDPLRAPAVSVRDGKVVSFCSRECKAAAESQPVVTSAAKPAEGKPRARTEPPMPPPGSKQTPPKGITKITPPKGVPKATPAAGIPKSAAQLDSGPVIEIVHEPASGVVTSAADARSGKASTSDRAETSGAIQIADTGHIEDYVDYDAPLHKSSRAWLVVLLLVVLGGGAFAAYQLGYLDSLFKTDSHAATVPVPVHEVPVPVDAPSAPALTADIAVERARAVLRTSLHSSPRVQRVAASALARTGDPEAIKMLAAALDRESSDLAKLDILYSLARGGDKRGTEGLYAALTAPRRDVRAEAARRLVMLGDKRAIDTLAQYLDVSQLRLGAAEQLAFLGEPRALKALDAVRADDKASADEKARATIALGHAGRTDVAPALHELLGDARNNAFAAASLASLHDDAARPVLIKQLEVSSLRISAARSLRQLDPALDPVPLLPPLMAALTSAKDTDQAQAAETILVLAGPPTWSVHE